MTTNTEALRAQFEQYVNPDGDGDVGANARLIAAAPELFEALVELRDWYTEHTGLPAAAANAAIAKAVQPNDQGEPRR